MRSSFLRVVLEANGRTRGAGDLQPRVALEEDLGRPLGHAVIAAEQEHRLSALARGLADRPDHARPRDAFGQRLAGEAARPDQRHSVGHDEVGVVDQALLDRVLVIAAQMVEVRRDRPMPGAHLRRVDDRPHRLGLGRDPHRGTHQAHLPQGLSRYVIG